MTIYLIKLLLHILCNTGERGDTADELMKVIRLENLPGHELIYDLLRVRKMEEQFKRGDISMY